MPDSAAEAATSPTNSAPSSTDSPVLILVRHGETEWSKSGQHTGRTDIPLTPAGEAQARAAGSVLQHLLDGRAPVLVISSPRRRALRTAELAGFPAQRITEDVAEWDYGDFEGLTTPQIQHERPGWSIWQGPVPGGEDAAAVTARLDRVLASVSSLRSEGPVVVFSHGHASRCLAARWLGEPVTDGRQYWLGTGAVSSLGYEHGRPVILHWNIPR
ncbi:histidine phosphatase family protein [Jatrophihabitans telluris]|uniref:Histidine phosphatase family protein n=1 Tax=Jatrophihabitans telluris TaxID=2038343 RepID=A0ABY4R3A7_9ACTN|nr:histidine phosphatase family protein [Jatrophihabitans telluris]UQX89817.1 histidine phosphatase family protein [Jatrophihabitans telluris]